MYIRGDGKIDNMKGNQKHPLMQLIKITSDRCDSRTLSCSPATVDQTFLLSFHEVVGWSQLTWIILLHTEHKNMTVSRWMTSTKNSVSVVSSAK